nr:9078_t:CDS:10 [Entrophospora candida]
MSSALALSETIIKQKETELLEKELNAFIGVLEKIRSNRINLEVIRVVRAFEPKLLSGIVKAILSNGQLKQERTTKEETYFTLLPITQEKKIGLIKEVELIAEKDQKRNYENQIDKLKKDYEDKLNAAKEKKIKELKSQRFDEKSFEPERKRLEELREFYKETKDLVKLRKVNERKKNSYQHKLDTNFNPELTSEQKVQIQERLKNLNSYPSPIEVAARLIEEEAKKKLDEEDYDACKVLIASKHREFPPQPQFKGFERFLDKRDEKEAEKKEGKVTLVDEKTGKRIRRKIPFQSFSNNFTLVYTESRSICIRLKKEFLFNLKNHEKDEWIEKSGEDSVYITDVNYNEWQKENGGGGDGEGHALMAKFNIAIDGPAGSGKTTIGKLLVEKLGYHFLDSGLFELIKYGKEAVLTLEAERERLNSSAISDLASQLSPLPELRRIILEFQRELTKEKEERARRRNSQFKEKLISSEVKKELQERDERDRKRKISPLIKTADSWELDTTYLSPAEKVV